MADAETRPKSITDLMAEINAHRRYQHRTFDIKEDGKVVVTVMLVLFAFDPEDCLLAVFHDVRQPLVYYTRPMSEFKRLCGIADEEQTENKLPEEMAAEAATAP